MVDVERKRARVVRPGEGGAASGSADYFNLGFPRSWVSFEETFEILSLESEGGLLVAELLPKSRALAKGVSLVRFVIDNDVNPKEYLGKFYVDSLLYDPKMLNYVIDLLGEDKIVLGSDYPFPLGEAVPGKMIESSQFRDSTKRALLSDNALTWLGINQTELVH